MIQTHWHTELAGISNSIREQHHVFAESMHSDVRGQIFNLKSGATLPVWTDKWPNHLFIVLVVEGKLKTTIESENIILKELSQLVILPSISCELTAESDSVVQIISLLSQEP